MRDAKRRRCMSLKKIKRTRGFALLLCLVFLLAGCSMIVGLLGGLGGSVITVGYCGFSGDFWHDGVTGSIKKEAAKRGDQLIYIDGNFNQAAQIAAIRSFISQNVGVIGL